MKVHEAISLKKQYGNITLDELVKKLMGDNIFECPNCHGTGQVSYRYDAYPPGLPDSGWAEDWKTGYKKCEVCDGHGYTPKQLKPKMVQTGWE